MSSPYAETRANIERRLILGVLLGDLDESLAEIWRQAFRSLEDSEIATLMRLTHSLNSHRASALTLRFLMERHYPFREVVLYRTDDDFKRRMGLLDLVEDWQA